MLSPTLQCLLYGCLTLGGLFLHPSLADELREGFFNSTGFVRLNTPVSLHGHIGLSFKSCSGGELFSQHTNGNSFSLSVQQDGLVFQSTAFGRHNEIRLPSRLLDNAWHPVNIIYRLGDLTLFAGGHQQVLANKTLNPEILLPELTGKSSVLTVGTKFHGCILEGPSLVLDPANLIQSVKVNWGPCPLKGPGCSKLDMCFYDPCLNHGTCVIKKDRYECLCTPRYSGTNCERDSGSVCDHKPCQNNGQCIEDNTGNFHCICNVSYTGRLCETPTNAQECSGNPCLNNGTCRVQPLPQDRQECSCLPGFRGNYCEINVNECQSNPCRNGGTCNDGDNSYSCACGQSGYTGEHCDVNVNECELIKPCLNQGTCFDNYGGYTCQCTSGFGGQNCELNLNECSSNPCLNGGTCKDQVGSYSCHCRPGFSGINCESMGAIGMAGMTGMPSDCTALPSPCSPEYDCINHVNGSFVCVCKSGYQGVPPNCTEKPTWMPCITNTCLNGGTCLSSGGLTLCNCSPGYTGATCSHLLNECLSSPCQFGGTCVPHNSGYICRCPEQRTGDRCERSIEIGPCASSPCLNKGVCISTSSTDFRCECAPGFYGPLCSSEEGVSCAEAGDCPGKTTKSLADPCAINPCNNGTCKSLGDAYECNCFEGFTGVQCNIDINECNENPKICNNGICLNLMGSFQCFCRPGYAGNQCDIDIDECLSNPCKNNATCENQINKYFCHCLPGYTGRECVTDIDECESNPCQHGGECKDHVAGFTCVCPPGLTGRFCETDIDDCESQPCQHDGHCIDEINNFKCDCTGTGYEGKFCEKDIDDCLSNPCMNEATCIDKLKNYHCECFEGYTGENCQIDVNDCEKNPCLNGGTCYEHSKRELYGLNGTALPKFFSREFNIRNASGYECVCVPGIVGANCETDLDECESKPCIHGECKDKTGGYDCECKAGFDGIHCEIDINECDKFKPCVFGTCDDRVNDYFCSCSAGYGGKNCSVLLEGCNENRCMNGGRCIPYLENETEHKFNCSCTSGFRGKICEKVTTMSLRGSSHVVIRKSREEGYDIQLKMKTTLPSGLLAIGEGLTFYMLELMNGRLNLRSSLLNRIEGVSAGSGLNDSKWQRVFVAINSSHLVLGANEEQTIYPITLTEANTSHTSFLTTYLGGTVSSLARLANGPAFVGCMEDVVINGEWVIPQDIASMPNALIDIEEGCPREEQCNPNLCHSGGQCTDLWRTFSCSCVRPYLGQTCQYNYTAATFGHENGSNSLVTVQVHEAALASVRNIVDISMFIRTRRERGFIFYLGSQPGTLRFSKETFIVAELEDGVLRVRIQFGGNPEAYSVGGTRLDNGCSHLIQVVRNGTLVAVRINGTENFRKTISAQEPLIANVLYLGGMPQISSLSQHHQGEGNSDSSSRRISRQIEAPPFKAENPSRTAETENFKGVIQDVQISNGTRTMVVEFFPLQVKDLPASLPFGNVSFEPSRVLPGEISDDTCRSNPCQHDGTCTVTWNDFTCDCPHGYKGKYCQEMEFCQLQDCPTGSECRNLEDGYECVANITLRGFGNDLLRYHLVTKNESLYLNSVVVSYRSHVGGTILHIAYEDFFFSVSAFLNETTVTWLLEPNSTGQQQRFSRRNVEEDWITISLEMRGRSDLSGGFVDADPEFIVSNFSIDGWRKLVTKGKIIVGGLDAEHEKPVVVSPRLAYTVSSVLETADSALHGNALDFPMMSAGTAGRYFKGCLGEIRIGGMLLPFFTPDVLYNVNFTASSYFALNLMPDPLKNSTGCILCFDEECQNGGTCEDVSGTHRCSCPVGFERDDCSKDIDWCRGPPQCLNNATCVDGIANFTCTCLNGFTGSLCEVDIDECASNPCVHGKCVNLVAAYECECEESYVGQQCESFKVVTCVDAPCKNGSTCIDGFNATTNDNFTCSCAEGFVGRYCNEVYCHASACLHGGLCQVDGTPKCACPSGFEGSYCEIDINECASTPCFHNGRCTDLENGFLCDCANTGYKGDVCNEDIDECALHIALCNEGRCNNTEGSYKCICDPRGEVHMCGYNCNITDPCSMEYPCQNGGECQDKCTYESDYQCLCPTGFKGKNCSEELASPGPSTADVAIIVAPIVAFLLLAAAVGLTVFIMMARKKRATRGTYSPSQQEYCNPRVEMDNVLKPPPEERLI